MGVHSEIRTDRRSTQNYSSEPHKKIYQKKNSKKKKNKKIQNFQKFFSKFPKFFFN